MNILPQSYFFPKTNQGKWSVKLNIIFLVIIGVSILLVNGFGIFSYNDRWWDITVPIAFFTTIMAFILGIRSIRKYNESSVLVYVSIGIGLIAIIFVLFHSLFISD